MNRTDGWEARLREVLTGARTKAFNWGEYDCASLAAEAIQALTGQDLFEEYRGSYSTGREAYRRVAQIGGVTALPGHHGLMTIALPHAGRGDIILFERSLGVCDGFFSFFREESGLLRKPTLNCNKAWRVP